MSHQFMSFVQQSDGALVALAVKGNEADSDPYCTAFNKASNGKAAP